MKNSKKYLLIIAVLGILCVGYLVLDSLLYTGIKSQQIKQEGFQGTYFAHDSTEHETAILIVGGGQWGYYWGEQFVKKGKVVLSLPYTGAEGLPQLPEEIPLEYFASAIRWLGQQKAVNPDKIVVMGASKNAELALTLASVFPDLISGAIAYAPSSVSWSNTTLPYNSDEIKASWTLQGQDIPFISMEKIQGGEIPELNTRAYWERGLAKEEDAERAFIPVEKIKGPVLLLSGKADKVWPSAYMADQLEARAEKYGFSYELQNIQFEDAGHLISRNPESDSDTEIRRGEMNLDGKTYTFEFGGTQAGDNAAKKQAKAKVLAFVEGL